MTTFSTYFNIQSNKDQIFNKHISSFMTGPDSLFQSSLHFFFFLQSLFSHPLKNILHFELLVFP